MGTHVSVDGAIPAMRVASGGKSFNGHVHESFVFTSYGWVM